MSRSGGAVSTGSATRLVYTIGLIKWITLGLIAVGVLGGTALSIAGDNPFAGAFSPIVWAYGAFAGLSVYVFMGWLQQTLLMLIGIARNTAKDDLFSRLRGCHFCPCQQLVLAAFASRLAGWKA
jgi:hypothetical protein